MFHHVTKLRGKVQLAKEMVAKSGRRNVEDTPVPVRVLWSGDTPLHKAARYGEVSEVKKLLAKGAEVDAKNKDGDTPLDLAAKKGHVDVVIWLLAKGAEVNAKNEYGQTPLHWAAYNGYLNVVKVLYDYSAEVNAKTKYGETPWDLAAMRGHVDIAKMLHIKMGAQVNDIGQMPFHLAARYGHLDRVKELLAKGAEVNATNKYGYTPLHLAAKGGHVEVMKALIAKGAEVDAKTKDGSACWFECGWTPLHFAAKYGHLDVVKALVAKGAEVDAKDKYGQTPLQVAHDEDVLKAFGQHFIKLAEHAKKSKESKEAPKIVTDTLQKRCLPEVAEWAVNHSYGVDAFPAEDSTARSCVLEYMSPEARERVALRSKRSYVFPGAGAAIAAVSVFMVEPLILHRFGSVHAPDQEEKHKFYRGAHLLVAKASIKCYCSKLVFRFLEAITIIAFSMGFVMVFFWWVWWLPFVGLLFLLPGIKLHGSKELMRAPVL